MSGVYKGLKIKFGADTHDLSSALNEIDLKTSRLKSNIAKASKALKVDPGNMELVRQNYKYLGDQVAQYEDRLKELKAAESQIGREKMSTEAWETLQREIAQTEGKLNQARAALRDFAAEQKAAGSALGAAGARLVELGDKLGPVEQKTQAIGRGLTMHVTVPLAAAAGASVKTAVDIDNALTGVKKTVNATAAEYEALKDSAIEFSKTSAIGATDILNAEELGGQLGVAKENLEAFAHVATGLDVSTNMNVESASMNMAQFMNVTKASADATKTAAEQYEAYGNTIVGLGNNLATTESAISDFSLRMASAGSLAGMSQPEILGIAAAMSSLGLESEAGGTAFSNTITEISKSVSTGGAELEAFARIAGKSSEEFSAKWREDAAGAFIDFVNGLAAGREAGEDMNLVLDELGITGIRQSDAIRRLAGNTELLGEAVAMANDQWRDGTALSDEVANRNESLAAKFEMLKHRLQAVAADIGEPLADALLEALDAAEPLFQAMEDGARSFSEMTEEQQQAVITTLALIAALGPVISAFSNVVQSIRGAGEAMEFLAKQRAKIGLALDGASGAAGKAAASAESLAAKEASAAASTKALGAASTLAKASIAGLVVGGVVYLATEIGKANDKVVRARAHQEDMAGSSRALGDALRSSAEGAASAGTAAAGYAESLEGLRRKGSEAASSFRGWSETIGSSNTELAATSAAVEAYEDTIARLLEMDMRQGGLDPSQAGELNAAVAGLNGELGTSYRYLSDHTGQLYDEAAGEYAARDAVLAHVDALQREQANSAYSDMYAEAQKKAAGLRVEQEGVISQLGDLPSRLMDVTAQVKAMEQEAADSGNSFLGFDVGYQNLVREQDELQSRYDELTGQIRMYDDQISESDTLSRAAADAMALIGKAGSEAGTALERVAAERVPAMIGGLSQSGQSMQEFISHLESAGVSADKFAEISDSDLASMARSYDGTLGSIADVLESYGVDLDRAAVKTESFARDAGGLYDALARQAGDDLIALGEMVDTLNAIGLDDKTLHVDDNGSIADEAGRIWDLNAQTIDGKHFTVNDDGTISIMGTNVDHLNAKDVADKEFQITDNGTGGDSERVAKNVDAAVREITPHKDITISATDNASSVIGNIAAKLSSLAGAAVSIATGGAFASGGISPRAIKLPRHADGGIAGIARRALVTNIGLVGENGAEAIVPLTNRRYVRPFAQAVASEMSSAPQADAESLSEMVSLLSQIRDKDPNMYVDGVQVSRVQAPHNNKALAREARYAQMGARR